MKTSLKHIPTGLVLIVAGMVLSGLFGCQRKPVILEKLVDVGDHRLHIKCEGSGSPTVVTDSGMGGTMERWSPVQPDISRFTRICSYDRAGLGGSDPGPLPRTSELIVKDLHALLANAGLTGPYVLVGHSFGGANVRLYAAQYPKEVSGMVLVESMCEDGDASFAPLLTERAVKGRDEMRRQYNPEKLDVDASMAQVRAANWRGDIPLVVVARGGTPYRPDQIAPDMTPENAIKWEQVWRGLQTQLSHLSPRGRLIIAQKSGHCVQCDQPEVVIDAVRQIVDAVRSDNQK